MSALKNPVLMAVVGAAHGLKGEVRVKTYTGDPEALGDYGPLSTADGRRLTVSALRLAGTVVVVRFREVATREAAEALNGVELFVDRTMLPAVADDEFYHADLIGLSARTETGEVLGVVKALHNFGGGDILELSGGKDGMIPFTLAAIPVIDIAGGFIVVDPVAAGLVDDDESGPEGEAGP